MSRIVKDINGDTLSVSTTASPTVVLPFTVVATSDGASFVQSSAPFTLTLTRLGNLVVMDWSEVVGTITGSETTLRTSQPIPVEYVPPAANIGNGYFIRPGMTTSLSPYGNPDSGTDTAAEPFLGFVGQPYYLYFGMDTDTPLPTASGAFILYAGSIAYHV